MEHTPNRREHRNLAAIAGGLAESLPQQLVSYNEAGRLLDIGPRTVRRLVKLGALECVVLPRGRPKVTLGSVLRLISRSVVPHSKPNARRVSSHVRARACVTQIDDLANEALATGRESIDSDPDLQSGDDAHSDSGSELARVETRDARP
jgi:hypothetical protein